VTEAIAELGTTLERAVRRPASSGALTDERTSVRPGRVSDLPIVHAWLMAAIDTSPHYAEEFKAFEKRRMSQELLRTLLEIDPWHVMILELDNDPAGFFVSGPEHGVLVFYWTYIVPRFRNSRLAAYAIQAYANHWEGKQFHKIVSYVRPDNLAPQVVGKRYGWREVALLENHLFGQDFIMMEKPLTKKLPGYDTGISSGRWQRWRIRLQSRLGF